MSQGRVHGWADILAAEQRRCAQDQEGKGEELPKRYEASGRWSHERGGYAGGWLVSTLSSLIVHS